MQRQAPILVTGGSGFIGAHLIARLLQEPCKVHVIAREESDLWRLSALLPHITLHRVALEEGDRLRKIVQEISPEAIFHLAAHGVSSSHQDRTRMLVGNVVGTFNLLQAAKELSDPFVIHMGGSSEYGKKEAAMRETDVLEPTTFYGLTKACSTLLAQQFAREHNMPIALLRPFSVYGPMESSQRLIPTAIRAALTGKPLELTAPGFSRDLVFVEDVIEACLLAWKKRLPQEILNIGTGIQTTNESVIASIAHLTGKKIDLLPGAYPAHPSDKPIWVANTAKAKALLGWEYRHTLEQGLQKTISCFLSA